MAVVWKSRRPRASIRSLLRNFQLLAEEKYPLKSLPEDEGKLTASPCIAFNSVEVSVGTAILEVTIGLFCFNKFTTSEITERGRFGRCSRTTKRLGCTAKRTDPVDLAGVNPVQVADHHP